MQDKDYSQEWNEYIQGRDYNTSLNLYSRTDLNWNFYNDKQWIGVKTNGLSKWQFNICKAIVNYYVAYIMSQKVKMQYGAENIPTEPKEQKEIKIKETCTLLSNMAELKWEKDKMDSKLRQLMTDGLITGDFAAFVYWDSNIETGQYEKGDFTTEVVDAVNVMFGNPNNKNVESQPYILLIKRDTVKELKKRAKANGISQDDIDNIVADQENNWQAGTYGKIELEPKDDNGKALSIIKLWKDEDGFVNWNESTKFVPIRKDVNLGIKRYPIAFGNCQTIKNSYHGLSLLDGIIDNQIGINQLFAMIFYWMKMNAFGKVAYDAQRIHNYSNKIGEAIKVDGDVTGVIQQLQAGNFNGAILTVVDIAIKYTKEFVGLNNALTGQVNPEQASGTAIIATQRQAAIPLSNITANRDQFVEDLGLIWGEFYLRKYNNRKVGYKKDGKVEMTDYKTSDIEQILLSCSVDVGQSSYWSELAAIQSLDNLLNSQRITFLQYLNRLPNGVIPDKQGLINDIESENTDKQVLFVLMEQFLNSLPPEQQDIIKTLPPEEMEKELKSMIMQLNGGMPNEMQAM